MSKRNQTGYTLIETMVTMVITSVGLLGLAGVQGKALQTELAVYQQAQAQMLMDDITDRVAANRDARSCYAASVDGNAVALGVDTETLPDCNSHDDAEAAAIAKSDLLLWDGLLDGVSARAGDSEMAGLGGARGCIRYNAAADSMEITIAWQGEMTTTAPASSCGKDKYGDDRLRRTLTETLRFAKLD